MTTQRSTAATVKRHTEDGAVRQCVQRIEFLARLLAGGVKRERLAEAFGEIRSLAASLPLHNQQSIHVQGRLRNAARYLRAGENGAARFELKMLSRGLA